MLIIITIIIIGLAAAEPRTSPRGLLGTANLRTKILDFRGFDSSRSLILRGGILVSIGDFVLENLSRRILAGIILV